MVSKYEIVGVLVGLSLIISAAIFAEIKISNLEKANAKLNEQVEVLEASVKFEKARADFAESVAAGLSNLTAANTTVEQTKVVYVNKVKNVEVKTATDYNNLVSELEEGWKCVECQ